MALSVTDTFNAGAAAGTPIFFDTLKKTFVMQVTVSSGGISAEVSLEGTLDGTNWIVLLDNSSNVVTAGSSVFYSTSGKYVMGARMHCNGGTGVTALLIAVE